MADITITVPDPQVDRVRTAYADRLGLDVVDVGLPEFKAALIEDIKRTVRRFEHREAELAIVITDVSPT
jgi:hypothetical protein